MSRHIYASVLWNYLKTGRSLNCYCKLKFFHLSTNYLSTDSIINSQQKTEAIGISNKIQVSRLIAPLVNKTVDNILSSVQTKSTSGPETVRILKALRMHAMFNSVERNIFIDNENFQILCKHFEENCCQLAPTALLSGLRSLLVCGMPADSSCVVTAEKTVLKIFKTFSTFNLIICIFFHHKFMETDLQKKLVSTLIIELQNRINEIGSASEILMLNHIYDLFNTESKNKLDQKIISLIPILNTEEIVKFLCVMAEKSNRNILILNSVSSELILKDQKPSLKETIDILYSCKKLNFFNPRLFTHLLSDIETEIKILKQPSMISGLLTVCGNIGWRHTGILECCSEWIHSHLQECKTREYIALLRTLASLNFFPSHIQALVKQIVPQLKNENFTSPDILLDVAWSLGVMECLPKHLLLHVLSKEFYNSLTDVTSQSSGVSNHLKLLNLKALLKHLYPECYFSCELYLQPVKLKESPLVENSKDHVLDILSNFLPGEKFVCKKRVTQAGILIDAEFIINVKLKPLPLKEYGVLSDETSSSKKLPSNYKRIALLIMFPKDYADQSRTLTGINYLAFKLLSYAGYTPITMSYEEFSRNKTEVSKTKYLSMLIKTASS